MPSDDECATLGRRFVSAVDTWIRWIDQRLPVDESKDSPADPTSNSAHASPTGFLARAELAHALGVHPSRRDAFLLALSRRRKRLDSDCWEEVTNPRRNHPRFRFRVDSPDIRKLAARYTEPA
jgi:hypothetical protein